MGKKMREKMEVFDMPTPYYPSTALPLDKLAYWIAFSRVMGIGPVRFKLLLDFFKDDVETAWRAGNQELLAAGLDQKIIDKFILQRATITPQQELERLERLRINIFNFPGNPTPQKTAYCYLR